MKEVKQPFISFKTKVITIIGALITLLLMAISLTVLFQWRGLILNKLEQRAYSVTQAFSVSVIDALIYEENSAFNADDFLETYILDFMSKDSTIEFITIYDAQSNMVAHSSPDLFKRNLTERDSRRLNAIAGLTRKIYAHPQYGWVLESYLPLKIGDKRWGIMRIGFDADSTRAEIRALFILLFIFTVIGNGIILGILYLLTNRFTSSLRKLVKAMDRVDLETKAEIELDPTNDEIGYLVNHFKQMQKRLIRSQKNLLNAQNQVYQAEKLASIGRLVSGIAHEINNPLNGIKSCLYTLKRSPENEEQLQNYLALISEGINHIEMVVQKLLGFARQPAPQTQGSTIQVANVHETLNKTLALLSYRFDKSTVKQKLKLSENLPSVKMDSTLLQEVLMNLIINSLDALAGEGTLTVSTQIKNKKRIEIMIKDSGSGIAPENMELIFEPFFTTKDVGEGTGLGLAVSKSIIEAHGGKLMVKSSLGQETIFTINLPSTS